MSYTEFVFSKENPGMEDVVEVFLNNGPCKIEFVEHKSIPIHPSFLFYDGISQKYIYEYQISPLVETTRTIIIDRIKCDHTSYEYDPITHILRFQWDEKCLVTMITLSYRCVTFL